MSLFPQKASPNPASKQQLQATLHTSLTILTVWAYWPVAATAAVVCPPNWRSLWGIEAPPNTWFFGTSQAHIPNGNDRCSRFHTAHGCVQQTDAHRPCSISNNNANKLVQNSSLPVSLTISHTNWSTSGSSYFGIKIIDNVLIKLAFVYTTFKSINYISINN